MLLMPFALQLQKMTVLGSASGHEAALDKVLSYSRNQYSHEQVEELSDLDKLIYFICKNHQKDLNDSLYKSLHYSIQEQLDDLRHLNFFVSVHIDLLTLKAFNSIKHRLTCTFL